MAVVDGNHETGLYLEVPYWKPTGCTVGMTMVRGEAWLPVADKRFRATTDLNSMGPKLQEIGRRVIAQVDEIVRRVKTLAETPCSVKEVSTLYHKTAKVFDTQYRILEPLRYHESLNAHGLETEKGQLAPRLRRMPAVINRIDAALGLAERLPVTEEGISMRKYLGTWLTKPGDLE